MLTGWTKAIKRHSEKAPHGCSLCSVEEVQPGSEGHRGNEPRTHHMWRSYLVPVSSAGRLVQGLLLLLGVAIPPPSEHCRGTLGQGWDKLIKKMGWDETFLLSWGVNNNPQMSQKTFRKHILSLPWSLLYKNFLTVACRFRKPPPSNWEVAMKHFYPWPCFPEKWVDEECLGKHV